MAAGRNVIGILGPAAAVGLGFFVPTVFYGVQPTPDTTTQLRTPYLTPPAKPRNNQIDASQGLNLCLTPVVATSTPRTPVLSPPFKFRISQSDASQPLNLPLQPAVQNPFIPVDYNISHDVVSAPPQHPPYNINIFTNPIPFIPVDYNIAHTVVSSPPQARPYNINLQTNPIPFGPYDYSDGPYNVRRYAPDQTYPNLVLPSIPLVPFDWSKPYFPIARVDPPLGTNPNLFTNPIPFGPYDWSARPAQYPPRAPDQIYPNTALTTVVTVTMPFGPFDWSKPAPIKALPTIPAPPYNINLFTNPIPFGPYDYSDGAIQFRLRIPDPIERNPNIFSEVPFIPVDYNIAHAVIKSPPQPQPYNPNILTNPIPFGPFDYNISHDVISSPPQALPYNINVFTNPIPFGPFDWTARPPQMPSRAPDQIERNPLIFSEVPIIPVDYSARPQQYPPRAPDQIYYDFALNVTPPPQAPFAQYDWSKPFYPRTIKEQASQTNINLLPNPIPFGPYDLSYRPSQFPPRAPDVYHRNPLIFSEVPLISVDLSRPVRVTAPPLVAAPPYNVALYQPPPTPIDLSTSRRLPGLPPQPQPYNVALLTPTGNPFVVIDWSKPFAVRQAAIQAQLNLTITLPPPPPAPIIPFDWNRPYAVRLSPPQPQPNLTLFLPPPVIIGVPALCFSKDFAIASSRAYETALAKARPADLALWKAKGDDVGLVTAFAKDIAQFKAAGNDSPTGQNLAQYRFGVKQPLIIDVSPKSFSSGTLVTITGSGFLGVTGVDFNGIPAVFTIVSDSVITATVP